SRLSTPGAATDTSFCRGASSGRRWSAPARAPASRAARRTISAAGTTWLRADGVPNELSAPTMGHKDTRMLDRVYARLPPELLRRRFLVSLGRCSAGAVNTSEERAANGAVGEGVDRVNAGIVAPRAGFEP